ncbi:MAG: NADH-quinone oxidoreductase subunit C, partial [Deferrisomatales bacterium]|nr:NADH-quinone oxidoreductase subunit C [Deferrisomatales bacterium]
MTHDMLAAHNPVGVEYESIPRHDPDAFVAAVSSRLAAGGRLVALFGVPWAGAGRPEVVAVVARDAAGTLDLARLAPASAYPSLTAVHPQAHALERALWEEWGVEPEGHPWLKPL